ncbi:hypothetical protein ACG94X_09870 [Acinetobacter sp. ULE_I010]|uniref:hypothetical protein n=1 Tax=Acinetobacter sp. ULE_I010 TaxID=3373065 RepID=UPI003AF70348
MSHDPNALDLQQQADEIAQQLEEIEQQQSQNSDWTSGLDVAEIGAGVLDILGDFLVGIALSL